MYGRVRSEAGRESVADIAATTHRGFTFHEQLDTVDLVHMNGRVYDPTLGRFISADPTIQAPFMSQSLNRYSYVMNNPLSMIDPSGFSWLSSAFHAIGNFISKYWRMIAAIVIAVFAPELLGLYFGMGAFSATVVTGMLAGGVATGTWQGALLGGVTGALFYWAGSISAAKGWGEGSLGHAFTHAVAGCASASIGGGSCGRGALSASFADYAAAKIPSGGREFVSAVEHGAVGGVASTLAGGSFGDGFVQGVAGDAFNAGAHKLYVKLEVAKILELAADQNGLTFEEFKAKDAFEIKALRENEWVNSGHFLIRWPAAYRSGP